jgi:hypothetical protein
VALAAFAELDWDRFDVCAIVGPTAGVATIDERRHFACREWLRRHGYAIDSLDCRNGLAEVIPALGRMLRWQEQFGYSLGPNDRNLDALRDGFEFDVPDGGGRVLELFRADVAWREDARWLLGLLSIAHEHSIQQLALGRRFFALLAIPEDSPPVGAGIDQTQVPCPFWSPSREVSAFIR